MMVRMTETRSIHSRLGVVSFVISLLPVLPCLIFGPPLLLLASTQPAGADQTGFAGIMLMLVMLTVLSEPVALGLGIAGVLQRHRKRMFAFLGIACSILVVAVLNSQVDLVDLASRIIAASTEPYPKVHVVSPGNE